MTEAADAGDGRLPSADDLLWRDAGKAMTPGDTLTRVNTNARATVGAVTLIGTLLSGIGLISAQTLLATAVPRALVLTSVALAVLAVLCGLVYLALRLKRINTRNIDEVKAWYKAQFRRAWLAVFASWLLVLAVILGAAAGIVGIVEAGSPNDPTLGLSLTGTAESRRLDVRVEVSGLDTGAELEMQVVGLEAAGCPQQRVLDGKQLADRTGKVTVATTVNALPCNDRFRLEVSGDGVEDRMLTIP